LDHVITPESSVPVYTAPPKSIEIVKPDTVPLAGDQVCAGLVAVTLFPFCVMVVMSESTVLLKVPVQSSRFAHTPPFDHVITPFAIVPVYTAPPKSIEIETPDTVPLAGDQA
jgi:hypothetical protein